MKKLLLIELFTTLMLANPQANQQAFQQGNSAINNFNRQVESADAYLNDFLRGAVQSKKNAEALIEYARRVNPKTLDGCKQVQFATEFCFVNFAKEFKEFKEKWDCEIEAALKLRAQLDPHFLAGDGYERKNCARFVEKVKETK